MGRTKHDILWQGEVNAGWGELKVRRTKHDILWQGEVNAGWGELKVRRTKHDINTRRWQGEVNAGWGELKVRRTKHDILWQGEVNAGWGELKVRWQGEVNAGWGELKVRRRKHDIFVLHLNLTVLCPYPTFTKAKSKSVSQQNMLGSTEGPILMISPRENVRNLERNKTDTILSLS